MVHIVVASTNPVKARAVLGAFQRMFPTETFQIETISVPSGVADQPLSDEETRRGARNRARAARAQVPDANYWVGVEGGVGTEDGGMAAFAWIVVLSGGATGQSRTASFDLPAEVVRLIRDGIELGHADDIVFGRDNSKQKNGAVGLLTGDVIDRAGLYEQAVVLALIPFKNPALFSHRED